MEHNVYLCKWSQGARGFALWLASQPNIRAEAETYSEAEIRFIEAIRSAGGAMQCVLEFETPLPTSELVAKYSDPELYLICGDDRFETDAPKRIPFETIEEREERWRWADTFFQSPVCRKCGYATGKRSLKSLPIRYARNQFDGAFGYVGGGNLNHIEILSEQFLDLLTVGERRGLQLRRIEGRGRLQRFYELLGPEGPPFIGVVGFDTSGWRCSVCGYRTFGYWIDGVDIQHFVARSDLSPQHLGVFTVGGRYEVRLVVTAERRLEVIGANGTRGFVSARLGVVPEHEVIREPDLRTTDEILKEQADERYGGRI
jgi:hypothetical protein